MVNDLNRYGIGSKVGSEKYSDAPCGEDINNTLSCFQSIWSGCDFDEEIDINDIHCDDGDSEMDEDQSWMNTLNFEMEEKHVVHWMKRLVKNYLKKPEC